MTAAAVNPFLARCTNALRHLARRGLTAAAVIANFHRQRVIPLTERSLPIFDLTPEAQASGSRTSLVLLPRDVAARRARNAVAEFPDNPEDLWKIKMRPETGYILIFQRTSGLSGNSATAFFALRVATSQGSSTSDILEPEPGASGVRSKIGRLLSMRGITLCQ